MKNSKNNLNYISIQELFTNYCYFIYLIHWINIQHFVPLVLFSFFLIIYFQQLTRSLQTKTRSYNHVFLFSLKLKTNLK